MHHYQQFGSYFGQTAGGMEHLAVDELLELGASEATAGKRGVTFKANQTTLYRVVYGSRLLTRVLATISTFPCHDTDYLYKKARQIDWREFIARGATFAILHHTANSKIEHSQFAALRLKDAIVDQLRDAWGERPDIDRDNPDVWLQLAIHNNRATINFDCAGHSLSKRGYRVKSVEAPMQETLAAAIVRHSAWDGETPLHDPFCGSGTLLAEALMRYCRVPASFLHDTFGFMRLPDYNPALWAKVKSQADGAVRPLPPGLISGSDIDQRAIEAARTNLRRLPGGENIALKQCDFRRLPPMQDSTILANPPYGLRLKSRDIEQLYRDFGAWLRQCGGAQGYVYSGDIELLKTMNLRPRWKKELNNGGIDGHLFKMLVFGNKPKAESGERKEKS